MTELCTNYAVFIEDGFSLISFSSLLGALHAANLTADARAFRWRTLSAKGGRVISDTAVSIDSAMFAGDSRSVVRPGGRDVFVLLSAPSDASARRQLIARLRDALSRGGNVLSVGKGTRLLCEEGILDGRRCAVHWSEYGTSIELFPRVKITRSFREHDGPFRTCAGEFSTVDAAIELVEAELGVKVSERITAQILSRPPRTHGERQEGPDVSLLRRFHTPLRNLVDLMLDNISDPLPLPALLEQIPLSRRQVERLFCQHLGLSPMKYYLRLRLERACDLLQHSHIAVVEIAVASGFVSASHFSKTFKAVYGRSPAEMRRMASPGYQAESASSRSGSPMNDNLKLRVVSRLASASPQIGNDFASARVWELPDRKKLDRGPTHASRQGFEVK